MNMSVDLYGEFCNSRGTKMRERRLEDLHSVAAPGGTTISHLGDRLIKINHKSINL